MFPPHCSQSNCAHASAAGSEETHGHTDLAAPGLKVPAVCVSPGDELLTEQQTRRCASRGMWSPCPLHTSTRHQPPLAHVVRYKELSRVIRHAAIRHTWDRGQSTESGSWVFRQAAHLRKRTMSVLKRCFSLHRRKSCGGRRMPERGVRWGPADLLGQHPAVHSAGQILASVQVIWH